MNDSTFHAARLTGIGSSDAPVACGVSPWRSQRELYLEKRGEGEPTEETEPMRFGSLLQPIVLAEFARRSGLAIEAEPPLIRSAAYPFMLAHLDARADGAVVEAKTARSGDGWGVIGSSDIPLDYVIQTHHQMIVADVRLAFVPVLIAGSDFRVYEVPFDPELAAMIVERESEFWQRVQSADPPPIDADAPGALEIVRKVFRGTDGRKLRSSSAEEHWLAVYREALAKRETYAAVVDSAKAHLLLEMGDAAELAFSDGTVLRRKLVNVKGYTVEAREQIDARFIKGKE